MRAVFVLYPTIIVAGITIYTIVGPEG